MGNQGSSSQELGVKLENDTTVTWKKVTSCSFPLREGQCACSQGNNMYVFGGVINDGENHIESCELLKFNVVDLTWTLIDAKGTLPEPLSAASLVSVGNKLYLFGGLNQETGWQDSLYVFDTDTSTWSKIDGEGKKPSARDKLQGCVMDSCIYYFGGFGPQLTGDEDDEDWEDMDDSDDDVIDEAKTQKAAQFGWFNDLYSFDTATNKWSQPMHMNLGVPKARAAHGMCSVGRNLLIFGGRDTEKRTNDLHIFNVDTRKWELDMKINGERPVARSFHTATAVGKRMVVMGGRGQDNNHLADFHIFDTETKEWMQPEVLGDTPEARGQHCVAVVGDKLVMYGGTSHFNTETMMCSKLHGDTYVLQIADVLKGQAIHTDNTQGNNTNDTQTNGSTS
ncbi:kelch domain-containing protein 1-like [Ruditapes philippinarum]|uniref:kelch domain-containing protein 1-like n=1 Tax=Ruditapes philippinarum TaxID=129788 RepID=UPI00295B94F0|nr:kelch domain-containing protein 1-like [Ruditapes philippinarum]XP_060569591.1 kelch domain-containing protein 1-like [Ruditapes philippinarum]